MNSTTSKPPTPAPLPAHTPTEYDGLDYFPSPQRRRATREEIDALEVERDFVKVFRQPAENLSAAFSVRITNKEAGGQTLAFCTCYNGQYSTAESADKKAALIVAAVNGRAGLLAERDALRTALADFMKWAEIPDDGSKTAVCIRNAARAALANGGAS